MEIIDGKVDMIYSALYNETEKYGRVESLSRFGNDGTSAMIWHKEIASKLKKDIYKIISIHCHNHELAFVIFSLKIRHFYEK